MQGPALFQAFVAGTSVEKSSQGLVVKGRSRSVKLIEDFLELGSGGDNARPVEEASAVGSLVSRGQRRERGQLAKVARHHRL